MFVIVCLGINGLIVHLSHVWLDVEALRLGRLGLSCINVRFYCRFSPNPEVRVGSSLDLPLLFEAVFCRTKVCKVNNGRVLVHVGLTCSLPSDGILFRAMVVVGPP